MSNNENNGDGGTRTRLVPMELVEVMEPIIAEPGDKLLIWQGRCFGVDTSRALPVFHVTRDTASPSSQKERANAKATRKQGKRKKPTAKAADVVDMVRANTKEDTSSLYQAIPAVLSSAAEPVNKRRLHELLGMPYEPKGVVDRALRRLLTDQRITATGQTSGRVFAMA